MKIQRIRKRDGREVPFDLTKIRDAVARAQAAVNEDDLTFALEVAQIVELALERRCSAHDSDHVPGIEEIQDLVEQTLIELGRAVVAKAYILYRDRRARIRAALEVRGPRTRSRPEPLGSARPPGSPVDRASPMVRASKERAPSESEVRTADDLGSSAEAAPDSGIWARAPRVQLSDGVAAWSKGRIVAALMNEAELPRASAERVAARVEQRVFDSGFRHISTALIRELVDNELVDLGLDQALKRQRSFGLARHDLRRLIADPSRSALDETAGDLGATPASLGAECAIASEVLRRYALEDLMPESVAELHLSGDLSIESLARPHLPLTRALPCELLMSGEPGPSGAFRVLDELAEECASCARGLVVDDCGALMQSLQRGRTAAQSWSAQWLRALSALSRSGGKEIDLCAGESAHAARGAERAHAPPWMARFVEDLDGILRESRPGPSPRLFADVSEIALVAQESNALRAALERLLLAGRVVPTFGSSGESVAGPGLVRRARERGALTCGGAVAINLPRLARRAGPWREEALLEELSALLQHALAALLALQDLQRSDRGARGRVAYAISPVGMRDALRWLSDGELRPDQGARILAFMTEAAQRFGQARGLSVTITPSFGEAASVRFAALDAALFAMRQPMLFEDGARADAASRAPYSCGFDLTHLEAGVEPGSTLAATAALLSTQRCGAIQPASILGALRHARPGDELSVLAVLERLELARARSRSGSPALYVLPRPHPIPAPRAGSRQPDSDDLFPEPEASTLPPSAPTLPHLSGRQNS
jgi:hypothetical protein